MKKKQQRRRLTLKILVGFIIVGLLLQSFSAIKYRIIMADYNITDSVKTKKGKFLNQEPTKTMQGMSMSTLKEFFRKGEKVPASPLPIVEIDINEYIPNETQELAVTWFGHSSALIEIDGKIILTDPALSERAGIGKNLGSKRFHGKVPVQVADLPNIDVVLISHDHFDHLDKETVLGLIQKTNRFIVPTGVGQYLMKWGVAVENIQELSWWESTSYSEVEFISTPARHFSGRGLFDRNTTLWCSWVIKGKEQSVYFSGDSGYQKDFKEIGNKFGPFDLSLLECGQYNSDWGLIHMSPEESVQAGLDTKTKLAMPIHWGAFNLSVHSWYEPVERFANRANETGLNYFTPMIGQRTVISKETTSLEWWKEFVGE